MYITFQFAESPRYRSPSDPPTRAIDCSETERRAACDEQRFAKEKYIGICLRIVASSRRRTVAPSHRRIVAPSHRRNVSECFPTFIRYLFRSGNIVTIQFPLPRETKHPAEKRTLSGSIGGSIRFCYASQTSMGVGELIFKGIVCIIYYIEQIHGEIVVRSFVAIAPSSPVVARRRRLGEAKGKRKNCQRSPGNVRSIATRCNFQANRRSMRNCARCLSRKRERQSLNDADRFPRITRITHISHFG